MVSPDGIHFRPKSNGPVYHGSDTQDVALWDPKLRKYVAFRRLHQPQNRSCSACAEYSPTPKGNGTTCAYLLRGT